MSSSLQKNKTFWRQILQQFWMNLTMSREITLRGTRFAKGRADRGQRRSVLWPDLDPRRVEGPHREEHTTELQEAEISKGHSWFQSGWNRDSFQAIPLKIFTKENTQIARHCPKNLTTNVNIHKPFSIEYHRILLGQFKDGWFTETLGLPKPFGLTNLGSSPNWLPSQLEVSETPILSPRSHLKPLPVVAFGRELTNKSPEFSWRFSWRDPRAKKSELDRGRFPFKFSRQQGLCVYSKLLDFQTRDQQPAFPSHRVALTTASQFQLICSQTRKDQRHWILMFSGSTFCVWRLGGVVENQSAHRPASSLNAAKYQIKRSFSSHLGSTLLGGVSPPLTKITLQTQLWGLKHGFGLFPRMTQSEPELLWLSSTRWSKFQPIDVLQWLESKTSERSSDIQCWCDYKLTTPYSSKDLPEICALIFGHNLTADRKLLLRTQKLICHWKFLLSITVQRDQIDKTWSRSGVLSFL